MATKYIHLHGKVNWVKAYRPDEKYDNYSVQMYLDEASQRIFNESGLTLSPKTDKDGLRYYTFRRPETKLIKKEVVVFGPPKVYDRNNNEFSQIIGNGSTATIKVSVYDTMKGKGHRWEAIRVEDLVEYVRPEGATTSNPTTTENISAAAPIPF